MIKRFIIAGILLILIGGGLVGFNLFRTQAIKDFFANMPRPTLTVSAITVEPVAWRPTIEAIGTVSAASGVDLAVETGGIVRQVNFQANDDVSAGQLLVQIDDRMEKADIAAAAAQLASDQQTLDRTRRLSERGVNPASTLDEAQTRVAASQAQVDRLNAVLDQKAIEAPFSGTIGIPRIEIGQYIAAGAVVATLQDLSRMRVDFTVPEQEFGRLSMGQTIRVADAISGKSFDGKIVGIDPKIDPTTRLISVRGEIENADLALQPGQFARIAIELPEEQGIVALPQTAVVSSLYGDFVYAVVEIEKQASPTEAAAAEAEAPQEAPADTDAAAPAGDAAAAAPPPPTHEARQIFVRTGRMSGGFVEILEGVSAGQEIVTAGQNRLSNGAPVTVDNSVDPAASARPAANAP